MVIHFRNVQKLTFYAGNDIQTFSPLLKAAVNLKYKYNGRCKSNGHRLYLDKKWRWLTCLSVQLVLLYRLKGPFIPMSCSNSCWCIAVIFILKGTPTPLPLAPLLQCTAVSCNAAPFAGENGACVVFFSPLWCFKKPIQLNKHVYTPMF